jgi:hypothetical protein
MYILFGVLFLMARPPMFDIAAGNMIGAHSFIEWD